jgi:hypothetical protein
LILLMPVHGQDLPFLPACRWAVVPPADHAAPAAAVEVRIKSKQRASPFGGAFFFAFFLLGTRKIPISELLMS